MPIDAVVSIVLNHVKLKDVLGLFTKQSLSTLLNTLADGELRAALVAIEDASMSSAPDREQTAAMHLLRAAHQKFSDSAGYSGTLGELAYLGTLGMKIPDKARAQQGACCTALLLAAYYASQRWSINTASTL